MVEDFDPALLAGLVVIPPLVIIPILVVVSLLVVIPLLPFYVSLQTYYRDSARDLKRLAGISLSPIYQHFRLAMSSSLTIPGPWPSRFLFAKRSALSMNIHHQGTVHGRQDIRPSLFNTYLVNQSQVV